MNLVERTVGILQFQLVRDRSCGKVQKNLVSLEFYKINHQILCIKYLYLSLVVKIHTNNDDFLNQFRTSSSKLYRLS